MNEKLKILIIILSIILLPIIIIPIVLFRIAFITPSKRTALTSEEYQANNQLKPYEQYFKEGLDFCNNTKHEVVHIKSFDGLRLQGYFYSRKDATVNIICVHGFHGRAQLDYGYVGKEFYNTGYNVLLIDMRGHGFSEGKTLTFGIKESQDIKDWVKFINNKNDLPIILDGVSMGSASVLMTVDTPMKNVKGIISDCGYSSPYEETKYVLNEQMHLPTFPFMNLTNLLARINLHIDLKEKSPIDTVKKSLYPIIVFHGEDDTFVPTYMGKEIYSSINASKKLVLVPNASHALSYFVEMDRVTKECNDFINKCIN